MNLSIEEKIELESKLTDLLNSGKTREDAVILLMKGMTFEECVYILSAYMMPYDEIKDEINRYDVSKPKLDEIKFVNDLNRKYKCHKRVIIDRIQDVRKITQYKEENQYVPKIKKKV